MLSSANAPLRKLQCGLSNNLSMPTNKIAPEAENGTPKNEFSLEQIKDVETKCNAVDLYEEAQIDQ